MAETGILIAFVAAVTLRQFLNRIVPIYRAGRSKYFEGAGRDHTVFVSPPRRVRIFTELCKGREISWQRVGKHWEPPFENEILSEAERREIFSELCDYFDLVGEKYRIIPDKTQTQTGNAVSTGSRA